MQEALHDLSRVLRKAGEMIGYAGSLSVKGNYREKNQDRACYFGRRGKNSWLAVGCVCDGIGSFSESEIAAEMVRKGIERWFFGIEDLYPGEIDEESLVDDLDLTLRELNELIWDFRKEKGIDIGCTMSAVLFLSEKYHIFHVGDSKILLFDGYPRQLTRDEVSLVERDGKIRTLLANFMGKSKELWMNQSDGNLKSGESFLIGSDGLFKRSQENILMKLIEATDVKNDAEAEKVLDQLIKYVTDQGERDNISGVLVRIE